MPDHKQPVRLPVRAGMAGARSPLPPLLGKAPLLPDEDPRDYEDLRGRVTHAVGPKDIIEEIWVKDFVDLVWEAQRMRRLKTALMNVARWDALRSMLYCRSDSIAEEDVEAFGELYGQWAKGDRNAAEELATFASERGLDMDQVLATAVTERLRDIEGMERLIVVAEMRRDGVLRELERRREALGRRLRGAVADVRDAELVQRPLKLEKAGPRAS